MSKPSNSLRGFSLVEVVLALGVIAIAIVAILGIVPVGLATGHSAQDDTRAAQIAQAVIASVASQTQTRFANVQLSLDDNSITALDLTNNHTVTINADNDGKLISSAATAVYQVRIEIANPPVNFDSANAKQLNVTVAWPASAAPTNQTKRTFVRIVSKY